ncbi:MAG: hypothetical protein ACR2N3_13530 [Pyrinomonadaceae bacterium]
MKNKFSILLVLAVMVIVTVGCGSLTDRATKAITDEGKKSASNSQSNSVGMPVDSDDDDESTGIPECDQAIKTIDDEITRESSNSNDSWAVRGTRRFMFTEMKRGMKSIIEEHKNNSNSNDSLNNQNIAQTCRDFQKKIDIEIKKDIADGK